MYIFNLYIFIYIYTRTHIRVCFCVCTYVLAVNICIHIFTFNMCYKYLLITCIYTYDNAGLATGWRRPIECLKLQVSFRKRATKYRALLRKIT